LDLDDLANLNALNRLNDASTGVIFHLRCTVSDPVDFRQDHPRNDRASFGFCRHCFEHHHFVRWDSAARDAGIRQQSDSQDGQG
jgi:hypothetical protein